MLKEITLCLTILILIYNVVLLHKKYDKLNIIMNKSCQYKVNSCISNCGFTNGLPNNYWSFCVEQGKLCDKGQPYDFDSCI